MSIPIQDLTPDITLDSQDKHIGYVNAVFQKFIAEGFRQAMISFSGGGDSGTFGEWTAWKTKVFDTEDEFTAYESNNFNIVTTACNNDTTKYRSATDLNELLDFSESEEKMKILDLFLDFLYSHAITVDFNGDCYSYGCILLDFQCGTILTKTRIEVKTEEDVNDNIVKVNNNFSFVSDNTVSDDL